MKLDLWSKLEEFSQIKYIRDDGNQEISQDLRKLTRVKSQKISSVIGKSSNKLNIIIAESHPIKLLAAFLAGVIQGADIFLCDPEWQLQEWQQVLDLVKPDFVFAEQKIQDLLFKLKSDTAIKNKLDYEQFQESLIMIPSGGSSGKIKFTMHNWLTLSSSVEGFKEYFGIQKINSCCTLPLYHVSGLMQFMRSFLTQGSLIIGSYRLINQIYSAVDIQEYFISLVPTQLQLLIESSALQLAEFKIVLLGGASTSKSLLNKARRLNIPLSLTYGMTETASGIATLKPEDFLAGSNNNGQVLPHAKVLMKSKANQPELIKIRAKSLCLGYYPYIFKQSIFTTDDLGYFDDQGYLHIVGRNSQKIITGGKNVFPAEVESAILATKLVKDICVIGISDRKWGQAVTAVYVPLTIKQDLNLIKQEIKLQLAKYKQPKNWIEVDILPRNNRGKINYQKVKEIALNKSKKV